MKVEKSPPSVSSHQLEVHSVTWWRHVTRPRIGCMTLAVKFRGGAVIGAFFFLGCRTRGWLASHDHTCILLTLVLPRSLLLCSFSFFRSRCLQWFYFLLFGFSCSAFFFFKCFSRCHIEKEKKKTKTKEQNKTKKISKTKRQIPQLSNMGSFNCINHSFFFLKIRKTS